MDKETWKIIGFLVGLLIIGGLVTCLFVLNRWNLEWLNASVMFATLMGAVMIGFEQLRRRPRIVLSDDMITETEPCEYEASKMVLRRYYLIANIGNRMSENIEVKGSAAVQSHVLLLSPNEKQKIELNWQWCCDSQSLEVAKQKSEACESIPYKPNYGISKDERTIYICNNTQRIRFDEETNNTITWIYSAKPTQFAHKDWSCDEYAQHPTVANNFTPDTGGIPGVTYNPFGK